MIERRLHSVVRAAAIPASVVALAALAACEERPYPTPSHTPPPADQPSADLMGAPASAPPPTAEAPAYAPPAYAPAPAYAGGGYDAGAVVAMAPIPNPDEGPVGVYDGRPHRRIHARYGEAGPEVADNAVRSPYGYGRQASGRGAASTANQGEAAPGYVPPRPPASARTAPAPAPKSAQHGTSATVTGAAAVGAAHHAHGASASAKHAAATTTAAPPAGDRSTRLASLQTALTDAIGRTAMLAAPTSFSVNQPADVSLTVPAAFADTLHAEAQKDGLTDAAASADLTAALSGQGFTVLPSDTQSISLASGQATEFHWTVTAQPGARGPLHADVGADLLGAGSDKLALGPVQQAGGRGAGLPPRVIGAALLVLIAALVVGWLAQARRPTRSVAARRPGVARDGRPLDMSSGGDGGAP